MAAEANEEKPINQQLEELWTQNGEKRGVPQSIRRLLNTAFTNVQVSSFPDLPSGKVVEIPGDSSIAQAVQTLAENNIFSAPVTNPEASPTDSWAARYKGIVDYPSIILWVLEQAELAAASFAAGSAAAVGMGAGAFGALGAIVLGLTGPVAIAGLATAAVGAAIAGGIAAERGLGKDASAAADALGEDFYKVILQEEPFKSTQVGEITKSYRWAPFLPIEPDESMLTVLLLLSKFRLRSIPVVNDCDPDVKNVITQSAVVQGLSLCRGRDWFDSLAGKSLFQIGLPVMSPDQMVSVDANQLVLEAFILMKEKGIGGLPVVEGPEKKLKGNISVRDVRYLLLQPDLFAHRRELTIAEFMKTVKWIAPAETGLMPPITCEKTSKLGDVIETLSSKKIHRIYVVDKGSQVAGVITLRDIIGCFVSEPEGYFDNYFGG
ncbi:unnamed protein product, partial [Sphagnum troendelagicum]